MSETSWKVGFGRKDLTPDHSVPLGGYGNSAKRMSRGWYSRLYATCIALTDPQDETLLLFTVDQIRSEKTWCDEARNRICKCTGVPVDSIMICATHTHSGPDVGAALDGAPYYGQYMQALTEAAVDALADRTAARAQAGTTVVKGMNFVRHYVMDDGSVTGVHFGESEGKEYAAHTMPADETMQLLEFVRQEKPPVLLINWQSHPLLASAKSLEAGSLLHYFTGADYVGALRDHVEQSGYLAAFFQGASGNINPQTKIPREAATEHPFEYGRQVGQYALDALATLKPVSLGTLQKRRVDYTGQWDHSEDDLLPQAEEIYRLFLETNDAKRCRQEAEKLGLHSAYHAIFITKRANAQDACEMELNAIAMGDVAFITAPYEMFCNNGRQIKDGSDYAVTFVLALANDACGYLASKEAFRHGCYEVDNRRFPLGTAEQTVAHYLQMLRDMKREERN